MHQVFKFHDRIVFISYIKHMITPKHKWKYIYILVLNRIMSYFGSNITFKCFIFEDIISIYYILCFFYYVMVQIIPKIELEDWSHTLTFNFFRSGSSSVSVTAADASDSLSLESTLTVSFDTTHVGMSLFPSKKSLANYSYPAYFDHVLEKYDTQ